MVQILVLFNLRSQNVKRYDVYNQAIIPEYKASGFVAKVVNKALNDWGEDVSLKIDIHSRPDHWKEFVLHG